MEDEEFSAWCDKNWSDDSLDEHDDEGDESHTESGDVADNMSFLFTAHSKLPIVLNKLRLSEMERAFIFLSEY